MSQTYIDSIEQTRAKEALQENRVDDQQDKSRNDKNEASENALLYAFFEVQRFVQTIDETAAVHAKDIAANAKQQQGLIQDLAQYNYKTLSAAAVAQLDSATSSNDVTKGSNMVGAISEDNEEITKMRTYYNNELMLSRQNAQVQETNINSDANYVQQSMQIGGNISQVVMSLTSQIEQM